MMAMRAVVLARGLGTRMRAPDPAAMLDPAQATMADAGMSALVPVGDTGRPFLDYILSGLADAGFSEAILVLAPEHDMVRQRYGQFGIGKPTRIRVMYAVQTKPTGSADAVLAVEMLVAQSPFVVLDANRYYPVSVLGQLRQMEAPALPAFSARALVAGGTPADRVASYATLDIAEDGSLRGIPEQPTDATGIPRARLSMNLWLFDKTIFQACREVPQSRRGEHELPEAVQWAVSRHGVRYRTFPVSAPVLDLARRADVAALSAALAGVQVQV